MGRGIDSPGDRFGGGGGAASAVVVTGREFDETEADHQLVFVVAGHILYCSWRRIYISGCLVGVLQLRSSPVIPAMLFKRDR
jgi:hypothetical protein